MVRPRGGSLPPAKNPINADLADYLADLADYQGAGLAALALDRGVEEAFEVRQPALAGGSSAVATPALQRQGRLPSGKHSLGAPAERPITKVK